jgi:curli production assembly/transport component CsgG
MNKLFLIFFISMLSGCAVIQKAGLEHMPEVAKNKLEKEFDAIPAPDGKKVTVAVYSFQDKTGQRKPTANIASLSMAVTQGGEVFLIRALQDVGRSQWFDVVERVNVDNLTKERTIIRQMREAYEGKDAKPLMPLQFAGLIMEGGIIGYDSGSESGGAAHRFLGIGSQTQYSKDTVTVSLRAVSVNTGKVLVAVTVTKVVYSTADSVAVLKFLRNGTQAFEAEAGLTINEPGTLAVKATIEAAVVELIKEGERRGIWDYKKPAVSLPVIIPEQTDERKGNEKPEKLKETN